MGKLLASKHIIIDDEFLEKIKDRLTSDVVVTSKNYTTNEAAIMLNLAPTTVRHFIRTGRIKAFKIGKRSYFIEGAEIERYINMNKDEEQ